MAVCRGIEPLPSDRQSPILTIILTDPSSEPPLYQNMYPCVNTGEIMEMLQFYDKTAYILP